MIGCELHGRLGNHLFQIATALSLAKKLNTNVIVEPFAEAGHRGIIPTDLSGFSYSFDYGKTSFEGVGELSFEYSPLPIKDNIKLAGFFQSHKYFDDIKEELIIKYFSPSVWVKEISKKYNPSENSLGICVRRDDYLMLQQNHCVLNEDYYQEIFYDIFHQVNIKDIFVFSDDMVWCRDVFSDINARFVEEDKFVQLYLMTQIKHLILANSTFSWWGAYLNENKGKIYVPNPWFGPNKSNINTKDLFHTDWIVRNHQPSFQQ